MNCLSIDKQYLYWLLNCLLNQAQETDYKLKINQALLDNKLFYSENFITVEIYTILFYDNENGVLLYIRNLLITYNIEEKLILFDRKKYSFIA